MNTHVDPADRSRYDTFDIIRDATRLKVIEHTDDRLVYHKMIQTGELEFSNYGVGFLNFEIVASPCWHAPKVYPGASTDEWFIRVVIATIDDGDMGAWSKAMFREQCLETTRRIAHDVIEDMVAFPTLENLNKQLRRFGIYVGFE